MRAGEHRAGDQGNGGNVGRGRAHQLRRNGFVAASDQYHRIHWLRPDHFLGIDRHEVAQIHAGGIGEAFMDRDGGKAHRKATREQDAALHRLDQLGHVAVTRVVAARRVGDADHGSGQRVIGVARALDERLPEKQ